jgi:hypothetical protein
MTSTLFVWVEDNKIDFATMVLIMHFPFSDIFGHLSAGRARADVAYCIRALARRLSKTRNWAVCLLYIFCYSCNKFVNIMPVLSDFMESTEFVQFTTVFF